MSERLIYACEYCGASVILDEDMRSCPDCGSPIYTYNVRFADEYNGEPDFTIEPPPFDLVEE